VELPILKWQQEGNVEMAISASKKVKENNKEIDWKRREKGVEAYNKHVEHNDLGALKDKKKERKKETQEYPNGISGRGNRKERRSS
jgi:hypothetical protein